MNNSLLFGLIGIAVGVFFAVLLLSKRNKKGLTTTREDLEQPPLINNEGEKDITNSRLFSENYTNQISELKLEIQGKERLLENLCAEKKELQLQVNRLQESITKKDIENISEGALTIEMTTLRDAKRTAETKISELQKSIEEQTDIITDLEFDKRRFERKLSEAKEGIRKLKSENEGLTKANGEFQSENENLIDQNTTLIETVQNKENEINFVNDLLSARPSHATEMNRKQIIKNIEAVEDYVINNVTLDLLRFEEIDKNEKKEYDLRIKKWAIAKRKTWIAGKKVVAFLGEFSAGKTSIVNRFLEQNDDPTAVVKLQVKSQATTAIPTYVSYGESNYLQFTDHGGILKILGEGKGVADKEMIKNVNISSLIQYYVLQSKVPVLKNLSILDTPGFNSNDKEDAARTAEVMLESDLIFWVFDANTGGINQTSVNVIKNDLSGIPIVVVINKADTKSPGELEILTGKIKVTMQNNNIDIWKYVTFSKDKKIDTLVQLCELIPSKTETDQILVDLLSKLDEEVAEAKGEYYKYTNEVKKLEDSVEQENMNIDEIGKAFDDLASVILKKPEEKRFFGTYYKMDTEAYSYFKKGVENLIEKRKEIVEKQEEVLINAKKLPDANRIANKEMKQYKDLLNLRQELEEKIKKVDKNLIINSNNQINGVQGQFKYILRD